MYKPDAIANRMAIGELAWRYPGVKCKIKFKTNRQIRATLLLSSIVIAYHIHVKCKRSGHICSLTRIVNSLKELPLRGILRLYHD